jgi:hypothetical protein
MTTRIASSSARPTRASRRRHRRRRPTIRWRTSRRPIVVQSSRPCRSTTMMMTRSRTRGRRRSTTCTRSATFITAAQPSTRAIGPNHSSSARSNSTSLHSARRRPPTSGLPRSKTSARSSITSALALTLTLHRLRLPHRHHLHLRAIVNET